MGKPGVLRPWGHRDPDATETPSTQNALNVSQAFCPGNCLVGQRYVAFDWGWFLKDNPSCNGILLNPTSSIIFCFNAVIYQNPGCFSLRTSIDAEKLKDVSDCWQNDTNKKSFNTGKSYSMSSYLRDHIIVLIFWDSIVLVLTLSHFITW